MARTTMIESCLPEALWAEALRTACHVRNRMVSRPPRPDKPTTPFEAYYGRKPELRHMEPFGCLTYVTRPHELRRKSLTQSAAYKAIILGYTESAHQYRVWNIRAGYIQLVCDATFNERLFPAASIGAYKNIFPQKPLPKALLANINNNTSLDTCTLGNDPGTLGNGPATQPSLEPENSTNIDRWQDANATAQDSEMLDHTETSGGRNEPENDFGPHSVELELNDSEPTEQRMMVWHPPLVPNRLSRSRCTCTAIPYKLSTMMIKHKPWRPQCKSRWAGIRDDNPSLSGLAIRATKQA